MAHVDRKKRREEGAAPPGQRSDAPAERDPMARKSAYPMISVSEALDRVLAQASPLEGAYVPLLACAGLVLAQDVLSPAPMPPFRASIVDGYAVVAEEGPGVYPVSGEATAGQPRAPLQRGSVSYITTGAPVPEGADAVIPVEDSRAVPGRADHVELLVRVRSGENIRPVGCDMAAGELVLRRGTLLGAAEVGILASVGIAQVLCHRRPRVGVMSTGNELRDPLTLDGQSPQFGFIIDSNRPMLLEAVREGGGEPVDLGIVPDEQGALDRKLDSALGELGLDAVVTSGGVSMGTLDLVKPTLERRGRVHFGRICMKPGKPTTFATLETARGGKCLFFALPGNPVSSLVCFHLLAEPALWIMAGRQSASRPKVNVRLADPITMDPQRPEYHRAIVGWDTGENCLVARSTGVQRSSRLLSTRQANALVLVPQAAGVLAARSELPALMIGPLAVHETKVKNEQDHGHSHGAHRHLQHDHHAHHHRHHEGQSKGPPLQAAVLTVSDRVSRGESQDASGPEAVKFLQAAGVSVVHTAVVADEVEAIQAQLSRWCDHFEAGTPPLDLVITTGGTGFAPRDVTPEATRPLIQRDCPGLVVAMLEEGLQHLPQAMLSRPCAGIRGRTLVVNLPGSPKAVSELLRSLFRALPHGLRLLRGDPEQHP